ncbi:MAG: NifB/NifX family molybdenum-iron cluster-binding protein, partial [Myxococcota bacterium]
PPKCRRIEAPPTVTFFKPQGIPMLELVESYLPLEGLEALRLADYENLGMEEAAARMQVSRHTFGRILAQARQAVATVLVEGRALRIEGGNWKLHPEQALTESSSTTVAPGDETQEQIMTKVAVTSEGPTLQDQVDPRFGRAGGFVVVDTKTMEHQYVDNGASQAMAHGAGIQAAERIANAGAKVVLTGFVGPKAFQALNAAGIQIGQDLSGITVQEAVERYKSGQVAMAAGPNK